jgi:hypothetical protein
VNDVFVPIRFPNTSEIEFLVGNRQGGVTFPLLLWLGFTAGSVQILRGVVRKDGDDGKKHQLES